MSKHLYVGDVVDDGALLDPLDEGVAGPVVCDGQAERVLGLRDLDLLRPALEQYSQHTGLDLSFAL